ncbi:hypothetical protein VP01_1250g5 [Puccinia sorghi]|uniref:Uncharacterized protein n=1 Tax=Puccinia sorghi TaxID=27349 RepID=A0A0L6VQX2_9BASI|nr:hypothetical protein VP01_1250g5 [Puccinia sorghi]
MLLKDQQSQSQSCCHRSIRSQSQPDDVEDRGKTFSQHNYENAITYLEDQKNYTLLFGEGSKTLVGVKQMTKAQAFEVFPTWSKPLNPDLMLNGQQLQQRIVLKQIPVQGLKKKVGHKLCTICWRPSVHATTKSMCCSETKPMSWLCLNSIILNPQMS